MLPSVPDLSATLDRPDPALVQSVRDGLPLDLVDEVLASGRLSAAELDRLAVPRKTLAHRRTLGRLSPEQSDRLLRVLRVVIEAERTFADPAKAWRWLRRPTTALAGEALSGTAVAGGAPAGGAMPGGTMADGALAGSVPLDLLDTDIGVRLVETLLGRIAHGIAA
ncbi:MAG: antitoxin Xre/MbcA/ParS toxin-binding domain-containing protein [Acetobacteraceae bacterium]